MFVDQETKTVTCKIAYYGPGLAGKTTNLQYLHDNAPIQAGPIVSTDIDAERTLHFQFIRNDLPEFQGYRLVFDFHTIPGQSYYLNTRLQLLEGSDGIVFVVDSTREAMDENIDSMNDLYENLRKQNIANDIPLCVQFNKQDAESAVPIEQLTPLLNSSMKQSFSASALNGQGVLETMQYITDEVVAYVEQQGFGSSSSYPVPEPATAESTLTPLKPNQLQTSPVTSAITKNEYWLLSCFACESILEVPKAKPGDLFVCGNCQQALQVVNPETGTTQAPAPQATATAVPSPAVPEPSAASAPIPSDHDESSYSMQALPSNPNATPVPPPPVSAPASENSEYDMAALPDTAPGALAQDGSGSQPVNLPQVVPGYTTIRAYDQSLLGNRYLLQEQATGVKVRALHISQEASRQPGFQSFLDAQVRQASQVHHQNAAAYVGIQMSGQTPVIISQHTDDCESLEDILSRRKKLSPPQAIDITHKLSLALTEMKRRGMSHGWIRPSCIQIGPNGTVILDDIAVPKLHTYLVREGRGRTASTEYYLAPEHHSGEAQSDERSDIFMLGILMFKMLSGEGAVTGFSAHEALHKLKTSGPRPLRSACPDLSRDIDSIYNKMCALERKDRFQSIDELADLLAKFGGGAKRHTLRQTKSHHTRSTVASGGSHTGQHRRNNHTKTVRRTTMMHNRTTNDDYQEYEHPRPRRRKSSNLFTYVLLLILVGVGIWGAMFYMDQQEKLEQQRLRNAQLNKEKTYKPKQPIEQTPKPEPVVRKSIEGQIEDHLAELQKDPNNKTLEETIMDKLAEVPPGKRRVQLFDKLKEIRELRSSTAQKDPTDNEDPKDPKDEDPAGTNTAKLLQDIDYHLQLSHFAKATASAKLIENPDIKKRELIRIDTAHLNAKSKIQIEVNALKDLSKVATLLHAPRHEWGFKGDKEWADNLYLAAKQRIDAAKNKQDNEATEPVVAQNPDTDKKALSEPITINQHNYSILLTDIQIDEALEKGDLKQAQELFRTLPGSNKDTQAIGLKLQLEAQAIETMSAAFKQNNIRFRVNDPISSKEKWDVIGIMSTGLQLRAPQGSSTNAKWEQIDKGEKEKLYLKIAAHEMASAKEMAIACIANLRIDKLGPATIAKNSARKLEYTEIDLLEHLISMRRSHRPAILAQLALTAKHNKNNEALNKIYKEFKTMSNLGADTEAFIEDLSQFISVPVHSEEHPNSLKNKLDFRDPNDLLAFSVKTGDWKIVNETMSNMISDGSIKRVDMKGTTKLNFSFSTEQRKGQMTVHFRGAELRLKFEDQAFHLIHGEKATALTPFPLLPNIPYNVSMWLDNEKIMHAEINQTAMQSIQLDKLDETMGYTISNNLGISIDNISYEREQTFVLPEVDKEKQAMIKTAFGWDPYGGAVLESPAIKLPPWPGDRSGISRRITPLDKGVSIEVNGSGDLYIMVGDKDADNLDGMRIPLPLASELVLSVNITWTKTTLKIESSLPNQVSPTVDIIKNLQVPIKHICLESSKTVNILKPPVMKR